MCEQMRTFAFASATAELSLRRAHMAEDTVSDFGAQR